MQNNLSNARVLVVGDIMLDRYYYGTTSRISPEAPVPVVHVKNIQDRAGGAGNVALNIAALSAKAGIYSLVGKDEAAQTLQSFLVEKSIDTHFLQTGLPTITKLRVLSQKQQLLRLDFEEGFQSVNKAKMFKDIAKIISAYNVMVLSDYGKGTLSDIQGLIQLAKSQGVQTLIDPKGNDFTCYRGATLITPNKSEFEAVVGACFSEKDIITKAKSLIDQCDLGGLLITRSQEGMTLVLKDGSYKTIPTVAREVFDVTGAGDTVIAVMAMGLSSGYDFISAMRLANAAAGVVVGKVGTATLSPKELHDALHAQVPVNKGILTQDEVLQAMKEARLQGEKIVMTNGCFDILHAGHVSYLQKARALGDRLIVAVNTDESVKRLKGQNRPIVDVNSRMQVLSALACVDWVIPFDEDTPKEIISKLLPDVLVKGADYEIDEIAGAKEVLANGGQVKTITLKPGHSTSSIVERIKQQGE
ncbi:bifunctional D-glycero-beta-D-manno-heptose-7-phosphate kinase/D-glycero-beta-D-manno-heptose 1-phosphate adenylyltransferase HldE [Facilibium subflavum]|uniref:bifunctional D-glycero-beta-D-manno-heptose-7-phosphate kinase/D-glycero-beta-D-manno-heptose 1-phosphate adenylyltransferase HldE n=1 Tax=Facilibium subflavum TaxID=2219058 RepID=UPI000E64D2AF|nr:bifunctional D-glycero-beta-D-manno-heptose-7-phosphate kinase/D-glycero-beta-D-manno-heptose 1-phosphate adenylyltransferase HldE [Facilibium subflavum]